jgi:hypothetical protein
MFGTHIFFVEVRLVQTSVLVVIWFLEYSLAPFYLGSRTDANEEWVEFSHDGDCGFAGVYQPPLPNSKKVVDQFIATSNYADIFYFLKLGKRASISEIGQAAEKVCGLDWQQMKSYNNNLTAPVSDDDLLQYCFRSTFVYQILRNGYGFHDDYKITAVDVLDGQKLGWALGSILYEINTRKSLLSCLHPWSK